MGSNEPGQPAVELTRHDAEEFSIHALPSPTSALAIGAHPDDVEFGCGGLFAKWAAAGCTIHHLICTDGSKGTWDPHADTGALAVRRQAEQREAARRLGGERAGSVYFLGHVDGELESGLDVRREVARVIRLVRPSVVLGHDPWKRYRLHPDHRHAGLLACEGIVAARDPHFFSDLQLEPHRPDALLLFEADAPDHIEDVSGFVDAKLSALEAHKSQFESTMHAHDEQQLEQFRDRIRARLAEIGRPFGLEAAEAFKLVDDL